MRLSVCSFVDVEDDILCYCFSHTDVSPGRPLR